MGGITRLCGRARGAGACRALAAGAIALAGLVVGTAAAWASDGLGIHTTYCQTIRYGGYVTLTQRGVMTPGGGGLVCYTGLGTARIDHRWTTRFAAGTHAGALRYREGPGQAIVVRRFFPGQSENFRRPVMVESLTITS